MNQSIFAKQFAWSKFQNLISTKQFEESKLHKSICKKKYKAILPKQPAGSELHKAIWAEQFANGTFKFGHFDIESLKIEKEFD